MLISSSPLIQTLKRHKQKIPPIWFMRQAGRFLPIYQSFAKQIPDFWERCFQPDISSEISTFPIQEFDLSAVIFFSDILIIPKILGQNIQFIKGKGIDISAKDIDQIIANYNPNTFHKDLFPVYQGLTLTRIKTPKETPILGFAGGAWTLLTYMLGANNADRIGFTSAYARQNPEKVTQWINALSEIVAMHLINQASTCADALQLFESHAASVPKEYIESWLLRPWATIAARVHKAFPDKPMILFPRGYAGHLSALNDLVDDYACVSIPETFSFKEVHDTLDPRFAVQGGPTPSALVAGGNRLTGEIDAFMKIFKERPFIMNLTHGVLPETPLAHAHEYINHVRNSVN